MGESIKEQKKLIDSLESHNKDMQVIVDDTDSQLRVLIKEGRIRSRDYRL